MLPHGWTLPVDTHTSPLTLSLLVFFKVHTANDGIETGSLTGYGQQQVA